MTTDTTSSYLSPESIQMVVSVNRNNNITYQRQLINSLQEFDNVRGALTGF
jgi:hypothetical protein